MVKYFFIQFVLFQIIIPCHIQIFVQPIYLFCLHHPLSHSNICSTNLSFFYIIPCHIQIFVSNSSSCILYYVINPRGKCILIFNQLCTGYGGQLKQKSVVSKLSTKKYLSLYKMSRVLHFKNILLAFKMPENSFLWHQCN